MILSHSSSSGLDRISLVEVEDNLNTWLLNNGFYGYDPYDILSQVRWYRKIYLSNNLIVRNSLSRFIGIVDRFFPLQARKVFNVKKTINAKGMGLLGLGYLYRYKRTKNDKDKKRIFQIADWLFANQSPGYSGISWGYPFDWQSRIFIPAGTPSIVVSYTVADFLFGVYEEFLDEKYLSAVQQVCEFIVGSLNRSHFDDGSICFSYTPLDNFQVHNANLFGAELLIRIGKLLGNNDYLELGKKSLSFALNEQLKDGSLNYWGHQQNEDQPNKNDHYHVGFEIRMLAAIAKHLNDIAVLNATKKYYQYYLDNFIYRRNGETIPKMVPKSIFPLDIHACAESIILNSSLFELWSDLESKEISTEFTTWIVNNMRNADGSFRYKKYKFGPIYLDVKIPYLRWGQGWMFFALNYYLFNSENSINQ